MTSGTLVIGYSLVWIMAPVCHIRMGSTGVRAPVWTFSGMGHWKRLIKIPGGTDCYYCINNMTCLIHIYYRLVVLIPIPDNLSTIMLHVWPVYFIPLPDTCYTFCGSILLMYTYTLHFMYFLCHIYIIHAHTILGHSWHYSKIIHVSHGHCQVIIYIHTNSMLGNDDFIVLLNNTVITY